MASIHPGVVGLKGGKKQQWLRLHRAEVLEYMHAHGTEATKAYFYMTRPGTFERFLKARQPRYEHMSKADKSLEGQKVLEIGFIDLKRRVDKIEGRQDDMLPALTLITGVSKAFQAALAVAEHQRVEAEAKDPLRLDNFGKSGSKQV